MSPQRSFRATWMRDRNMSSASYLAMTGESSSSSSIKIEILLELEVFVVQLWNAGTTRTISSINEYNLSLKKTSTQFDSGSSALLMC